MSVRNSTHFDTISEAADAPLTPVQARVLAALAEGTTVTEAARQAGVHRSTIYNWFDSVPALGEMLERTARARTTAIHDQILELAGVALDTIRHFVTDENTTPALRLRAALALVRFARQRTGEPTPAIPEAAINSGLESLLDRIGGPEVQARMKRVADQTWAQYVAARDQVASLAPEAKGAPAPPAGTPRNALCPCGSGVKYKRCCGSSAPPVLHHAGLAAA